MIYLLLYDIITLAIIAIFLMIIYRRIVKNWNFVEQIRGRYSEFDRKSRVQNYVKRINRGPVDPQEVIFKETIVIVGVILIIFMLATKSIFIAAVVSDSMTPTFDKNDMILAENIDRRYNVGDIIMFERPDTALPVAHRIIAIGNDEVISEEKGIIRTAGDATKGMDWWKLKEEDVIGKVIAIQGEPVVIKGYGKFFIVEDKNQRFGPFDYQNYYLFISVVKAYGFAIAILSLLIYVVLTLKEAKEKKRKVQYINMWNRYE